MECGVATNGDRITIDGDALGRGKEGDNCRDLIRLNAYVASAQYLGGYMKVRDEFVGNPPPASTLMVVQGFARPEFKVEIEAVAARAP